MRIIKALLICSLVLAGMGGGIARAQEAPPNAPAAPDSPKLVVFELFTRNG